MTFNIEETIIKYLEHTASVEQCEQLNRWLQEDKQNLALFCQLQEIWDSKRQIPKQKVAQEWEQLYKECQTHDTAIKQKKNPTQQIPLWIRYSAAIIVGFLMATYWSQIDRKNNDIVQNQVYNHNGIQKLLLPDSTTLWLHANSRIRYPEQFSGDIRQVYLEGKAFFEVRKNSNKPFIVKAGNVNVQVTGTEFEIESVSGEDKLVTLISGGIIVESKDNSGKKTDEIQLTPGHQAVVDQNTGSIKDREIDTAYYLAWKDGTYRFVDKPLEIITKQLAQKYNIKIRVSPELIGKRFTGQVTPGQNIQEVLEIIQKSHPVRYNITSSVIYITEK